MDQQPKIPTLKDAQKPQVKIKGMGAGLTLFDRLKQFKKKDLAFILAGLGTLFMAPLAEHFMMAPENGDMSSGFRGPGSGGATLWGSGSSPYENGNNNIAQGGAIGGSGDIITPLNVRDPSALVMGPGSAQQPPAGSAAPVTPPVTAPASSGEDYRDALKGAAANAASAAVKRAPLPIPKIAFSGSGLRGLGAASGGNSSGSGSLGPINSGNLGQAGTGGGGLNMVRSAPGFRSAAGARSPTGGTGLDGTKRAGANAGDAFSRTGSALGGLNAAANEQIPTAGQGFGGGGQGGAGANDKPGGGAGAAGSKSVGESLAFIEAKERMMENLKLEFEKKKLWDKSLLMGGIRNDMAKGFATELGKVLTKHALAPLSKEFWAKAGDSVSGFACAPDMTFYPDSGTDVCMTTDGNKGAPGAEGKCVAVQPISKCTKTTQAGKAAASTGATEGATSDLTAGIGTVCTQISKDSAATGSASPYDGYVKDSMKPAAQRAETSRNMLIGGGVTCGGTAIPSNDTASALLGQAKALLFAEAGAPAAAPTTPPATPPAAGAAPAGATDALGLIKAGADKVDPALAKVPAQNLVDAEAKIAAATAKITAARTALGAPLVPSVEMGGDKANLGEVNSRAGQVIKAQTQATDLMTKLTTSAQSLTAGIRSIEPLVKTPAGPVGALPDQLSLNKTSADLTTEAGVTPPAASKAVLPTVKGDAVKEQADALVALTELQTAINTAAKPTATEPEKAAVKTKLDAAKAKLTASQTALTAAATAQETNIRSVTIEGAVR